jgi:hypothetical protein
MCCTKNANPYKELPLSRQIEKAINASPKGYSGDRRIFCLGFRIAQSFYDWVAKQPFQSFLGPIRKI